MLVAGATPMQHPTTISGVPNRRAQKPTLSGTNGSPKSLLEEASMEALKEPPLKEPFKESVKDPLEGTLKGPFEGTLKVIF